MAWLETITTGTTILRNILSLDPQPNEVLEVKLDQYENRSILRIEDGIVLYEPNDPAKDKYEIVLEVRSGDNSQQAYSIFRSDTSEAAEHLFSIYKDKVPLLLGISKEMCNTNGIRKICNALTEHPTWTLAHLAANLLLYDALNYVSVNGDLNVSDEASGMSPLQVAVQTNDSKIVQILLAAKSSLEHLDKDANSVFHHAVRSSKEIISTLGSAAPQGFLNRKNNSGYTPLHVAYLADKPEAVKALLLLGADVNIPPGTEESVKGPANVAEFLREKPDALNWQDIKFGGTPLHWSTSKEVTIALIEKNCDIDALNFNGKSVLHVMVTKQKLDCVITLLVHKALVNIVDKDGNTPLHLAAAQATPTIVQALLVFGTDINPVNQKRETPRHLTPIDKNAEGRRVLYLLHAVGAQRCPPEMEGCQVGCKYGENFDGEAPPEPPSAVPRTVLDQMLYVAGVEKLALKGEEKVEGGRLLCLDGGGIRGLVLVQTLLEIESLIQKSVVDCFDWIAGTSTGGIVALGLASGKSLRECQVIYFNVKEKAFVGFRPYSSEGLEEILKTALGSETMMSDIKWPKLIITTVLADRMPVDLHLFRNYESPSSLLGVPPSGKFKETYPPEFQLAWKAARATGAAPTYFRAFGRFLDGGLIANNPTLDALTEIEEYNLALRAVGRADEVKPITMVVSLGTGRIPVSPLTEIDVFRPESIWDTAKLAKGLSAVGTLLVEQATASDGRVVDRARTWCSMIGVPYYRFNPQISEEISMDESSDEKLVKMMWEVKAFMYANRNQVKELAALLDRQ